MKKSLFALAALGAIASTAQAQSSVTVYGVIDEAYVGANTRIANPGAGTTGSVNGVTTSYPATTTGGVNGVTNTTQSTINSGAESTSRLGFKGNEDLGGGLSAFFTYELGLNPNAAQVINMDQTQTRQAFVGLKKAGVGQFALGTQYTTIFNAASQSDPGMLNNMMGNVIYDKGTGVAPTVGTAATVSAYQPGSPAYQYSGMQNNTSFTVRAANMLSVATDTFSGFQGNGFIVLNNVNTNQTSVAASSSGYAASSGTTNHTAWGLGANYTWQKLFVTANYQNFTDKNPYALNPTNGVYSAGAPVQGYYAGQNGVGTNDKDNQQYYAATYDFGILKAYVQYVNRKTLDVNNSSNYLARTAQQIGVRSFVTPVVEAWASAGTGKLTVGTGSAGSNSFVGGTSSIGTNSANFGGFQLGTNYYLSKRTNLYAIYGQERTSNQSYTSGANPVSYNANNYALGVRHTF